MSYQLIYFSYIPLHGIMTLILPFLEVSLFKETKFPSTCPGYKKIAFLASNFRCVLFGIPHIQISLTLRLFLLQHSIVSARTFKSVFSCPINKCSCQDSRLLTGNTVSYPLIQQDNDAWRCNYLFKNERISLYRVSLKKYTRLMSHIKVTIASILKI